jgi:hypothetical protein
VGYDKDGLPIGLQLIGQPWAEATLLRLASAIEVNISLEGSKVFTWCIKKHHFLLLPVLHCFPNYIQ